MAGIIKKIQHKQLINILELFLIVLLLHTGNAFAGQNKQFELRDKIDEILSLREKFVERQAQTLELCEQFKGQIMELSKEIKNEKKRNGADSYQEAVRNPRINYNIKLIQRLLTYICGLNDKIKYIENSNDELKFFYRQADDVLRICETLSDMNIEKLINQIDQKIEMYQPEADKLSIDIDNIGLIPCEKIWNKIIKEKRN